jgi:hypothetical protein
MRCEVCHADAIGTREVAVGSLLRDVPLCEACESDAVCHCPACDQLIFQNDGIRVYSDPDLYCRRCGEIKNAAIAASQIAHRRDVERDDMDSVRRG